MQAYLCCVGDLKLKAVCDVCECDSVVATVTLSVCVRVSADAFERDGAGWLGLD